ncbi:hypothetical protein GJAV_G00264750 [Gymnothorax javanicus]|nr:hypothetical protein GJAV_G00264750 [Gymnothorax javanicus]
MSSVDFLESKKVTEKQNCELGLVRRRSRPSNENDENRTRCGQQFSYLIVIDFESTCWEDKNSYGQEIIEFPDILLNTSNGKIESEFHSYVQPQEHPVLSRFCTELTGIQQEQVEAGVPLHICLSRFTRWIQMLQEEKRILFIQEKVCSHTGHPCAFVTWSDWDLGVCLQYECKRKQIIKPEILNRWIDLRATYKLFYNRKPKGLNGALQDLGIRFSGREHSGLDDARNTAHLAWRMITDGCLMKLTRSLDRAPLRTKPQLQMNPSSSNAHSFSVREGRIGKHFAFSPNCAETTSGSFTGIHDMNPNRVTSDGSSVTHASNSATNSHQSNNDVHTSTSSQHGPASETPAATHGMPMNPSTEHDIPMSTSSQHGPEPETPAVTHGMPMMNPSTEHDMPMSTSSHDLPHETPAATHGMPTHTSHPSPPKLSTDDDVITTPDDLPHETPAPTHGMPTHTSHPSPPKLSTDDDVITTPEDDLPHETPAPTHGMPTHTSHPSPPKLSTDDDVITTPEDDLPHETPAATHGMPTHTSHPSPPKLSTDDDVITTPEPTTTSPLLPPTHPYPFFDVRLVDGSDRCAGRVEASHLSTWGPVCNDRWDMNTAEVLCRELGCGSAVTTTSFNRSERDHRPQFNVMCSGHESSLLECDHSGFEVFICKDQKDAGVICSGEWGAVCDDHWDMNDAEVVCRELGCGSMVNILSFNHSEEHDRPDFLESVMCLGNESSLMQCQHSGFGERDCMDHKDAGVVCSGVRLVGGSDRCSGRLEVYHLGEWGAVCDDYWDMNDAEVVCRELGCGSVVKTLSFHHSEEHDRPDFLESVMCLGNESSLMQCQHSGFGEHDCMDHKDAGVVCSGEWGAVCDDHWDMNDAEVVCRELGCGSVVNILSFNHSEEHDRPDFLESVMCLGNESSLMQCQHSGFGERDCMDHKDAGVVCSGEWGAVCDDYWDMNDAEVVCRDLGCGSVVKTLSFHHSEEHDRPDFLESVMCLGNESSLMQCQHSGFGEHDCMDHNDAGVVCSGIRLVGGRDQCSGRLEVYHLGEWGAVCDDHWDMNDAEVVCRELGCGSVVNILSFNHSEEHDRPDFLESVMCLGNESSLMQCQHSGFGERDCMDHKDAGVVCSGEWGAVCDDYWDMNDAEVVCRELGCGSVVKTLSFHHSEEHDRPDFLESVMCLGNESSLMQCQHSGFGEHDCMDHNDAGVVCSGEWGAVCDDHWDMNDAEVVCRELGCGSVVNILSFNHSEEHDRPDFLESVMCLGNESSLMQCQHSGFGEHDCMDHKDAGVVCSGEWGAVCDDYWDMNDAEVVCRELGCGSVVKTLSFHHSEEHDRPDFLESVMCLGNESSLMQCQHSGFGEHDCMDHNDAGVVCSGEWGAVCDDHWDMNDAEVVCRELGCGSVVNILSFNHSEEHDRPDFLESVMCLGNESSLMQCQHSGFGEHDCMDHNDAGVVCSGEWGAVCDDYWDMNDAEVVCRELGCGSVVKTLSFHHSEEHDRPDFLESVMCLGNESSLMQCQHSGFGEHDCMDHNDAGVVCSGEWGAVCDDHWDMNDAEVVCRELGCGSVVNILSFNHSEEHDRPDFLESVMCLGNESSLMQCQHSGFGEHDCMDHKDAGVVCSGVRLVGGSNRCSGRLEVYHLGEWGAVCDDYWDMNDAEVVCRELGCGSVVKTLSFHHSEEHDRPDFLESVMCLGNESSLMQCQHSGFGEHDCMDHNDAGVVCSGIRLVGGRDQCSGRLEVYHLGEWGAVCDDHWDMNDAEVVCRELGCGSVVNILSFNHSEEHDRPDFLESVMCLGNESSLMQCQHSGFGEHDCMDHKDAGVVCSGVRLVGGSNRCSGRLEVYHLGEWGAVCDDYWDMNDAEVVCRELGCGSVVNILSFHHSEEHDRPDFLESVMCLGNESSLMQCQHSGFGEHDCMDHNDAGVVCSGEWGAVCDDHWDMNDAEVVCRELGCGSVVNTLSFNHSEEHDRPDFLESVMCLGNESSLMQCQHSGFGEHDCMDHKDAGVVCSGEWRAVCDDYWDMNDAEVVCRELGCGSVVKTLSFHHSEEHDRPDFFESVMCLGNESSLMQCQHSGFGEHDCMDHKDAGVVCSGIRLVGGSDRCSGRLEVYHLGEWGAVCDDHWDMNDAEVVCRELGCGSVVNTLSFNHSEEHDRPDFLESVMCFGNESSLMHCQHSGFGEHDCMDHKDAGVVCSESALIRLVDGTDRCSGKVEVFHGQWGAVCHDQWDMNDAEVVCRYLDCGSAVDTLSFTHDEHSRPDLLDEVMCYGNESSLRYCQHAGFGPHNCTDNGDAGVVCSASVPANEQCPSEIVSRTMCDDILEVRDIFLLMSRILSDSSAQVRLVNGSSGCSGRVEVLHDGQWGTVCDNHWDLNNAEVVCREVGCGRALGAAGSAHSGQGSGPIWLDDVKCKGTESSLKQCQHRGFGKNNCSHHKDAAAICSGMNPLLEIPKGH